MSVFINIIQINIGDVFTLQYVTPEPSDIRERVRTSFLPSGPHCLLNSPPLGTHHPERTAEERPGRAGWQDPDPGLVWKRHQKGSADEQVGPQGGFHR